MSVSGQFMIIKIHRFNITATSKYLKIFDSIHERENIIFAIWIKPELYFLHTFCNPLLTYDRQAMLDCKIFKT